MADYDLGIRGGHVFFNGELVPADVWISGERIGAVESRGSSPAPGPNAARTIDATGRVVLPGAIDTHTHVREPGYTHKEDFGTASRAAAVGGVTTIIDMPNVEPPTDTLQAYREKVALAEAKSIIDWGHWVAGTNPEEIPKMAAAGATGFKIFQVSGVYPHDPRLAINEAGPLLRSFRAIAKTGLPCLVHPFNQSLFEELSDELIASGRKPNTDAFSDVYTREEVWATAVAELIALQRISGVRLHLLHTHSSESLRLIRQAKGRSQHVTCEVDPKYFHMRHSDITDFGGKGIPGGYITENPARMAEIWRSLADGTINNIATDHAPHTSEEADHAEVNAWEAHLGSPQVEWLYAIVLTDVADGKLPLARGVQLLTEGPARVIGVWPDKGAIMPGALADIAVVDLDREWVVTEDNLQTKVHWSPYVGRRFKGKVVATVSRGRVVAEDGEVTADPGTGRYVPGVSRPLTQVASA